MLIDYTLNWGTHNYLRFPDWLIFKRDEVENAERTVFPISAIYFQYGSGLQARTET